MFHNFASNFNRIAMKSLYIFCIITVLLDLITSVSGAQRQYGMSDGLPNMQTRQVVCMPDGRIVVQTSEELSVFDGEYFKPIELDRRMRVEIESFWSIDHYVDKQNRLWIKTNSDLYVIDCNNYTCLDAKSFFSGIKSKLRNVFLTSDNVVWADGMDGKLYKCTESDTVAVLNIKDLNTEGIRIAVTDITKVDSRYVVLLSDGSMQVLGRSRYQVVDPQQGYNMICAPLDSHRIVMRRPGGIDIVDVTDGTTMKKHDLGNLFWVSSVGDGKVLLTTYHDVYEIDAQGEPHLLHHYEGMSRVQGVAVDRFGGLWTCTFNDGLLYSSPYKEMGRWRETIYDNNIVSSHVDSKGRIWQTWDDGRITDENRCYDRNTSPGLWGKISFCIEVNEDTYLTCVRMNRLALFTPPKVTLLSNDYPAMLRFRNIVDGCRVGDHVVVASQNGVYAFDCKTMKPDFERYASWNENKWSNKVNCLLADADTAVFIGTAKGLFRVDDSGWTRYAEGNIQSMVCDVNGKLWWTTIDGNVTNGKITVDTKTTAPFLERRAVLKDDGTLEFSTGKATLAFHPDSIDIPVMSLKPYLLSVTDTIMTYDHSNLHLCMSALAYGLEEHVVYRYRLRGAETMWHEVTHSEGRLLIDYSFLPPGNYVLEVQASLHGQQWGDTTTISVKVTPPLWRTWWAYLLYILILIVVVLVYVNMLRARMDNERKEARIRALLNQIDAAASYRAPVQGLWMEQTGDNEPGHTLQEPESRELPAIDTAFLAKAKQMVEEHIDDAEYGVEQFSNDMAMERTTLYRHIKKAVGQTPIEFLRTVRLHRAEQLLLTGRYSVSEVSDMTGFATARTFSKYFKKVYGVTPSSYTPNSDKLNT